MEPSQTADPSEPPEPSEPAGPVATGALRTISKGAPGDGDLLTYRLPTKRWTVSELDEGNGILLQDSGVYFIAGRSLPVIANTTIDDSRRATIVNSGPPTGPRVSASPDRIVDGVEGYVVQGDDRRGLFYEFGARYENRDVVITLTFPQGGDRSEEWIEAVLASVEWL